MAENDFAQLFRTCMSIKCIELYDINITDTSLKVLATELRLLTHISLYECRGYTDEGLLEIANQCPKLQDVFIDDTPQQVTEVSLLTLIRNHPQLYHVDFAHIATNACLNVGSYFEMTDAGVCI